MNKLLALIQQGKERLHMGQFSAEASKTRSLLRVVLRRREPRASKGCIIAARGVVIVVGVYFAAVGAFILSAGCLSASWGSILAGVVIIPVSLHLAWSGITRIRENACSPAVAFVAEFLSRFSG